MSIDLTFDSVCSTLKKQAKNEPELIKAIDILLGLALVCSSYVLEPTLAALLPTLTVKNEIMKIGRSVFEKLTKKKDDDYLLRYQTMYSAYCLLVFTSFFDALDFLISNSLRIELTLLDNEKSFLVKYGVNKSTDNYLDGDNELDLSVSTTCLPFPHPTESLKEQSNRHAKLWKQMSHGFIEFVQKLALWDDADDKKRTGLLAGLNKIEEEATKRFEAQYFELARRFEDFAIWANLQAHRDAKALIDNLSDYVKQYAELSAATEKNIDIGFVKLRQTVLSIPETLYIEQATEIATSLNKHYQARVNDPILKDNDLNEENAPQLTFPKVSDAFVPQAFKVLRLEGKSRRLEDEATWNTLPRRNDLGAFLLSYLSSPYSTETPLLILGHPGSGKSLLTTLLAAQLMSKQFTAISLPLRELNADADIQTQIEEFIKRISGVAFDSWIKLRSLFKNCPPVVILDGYDELLQASGQVFASYIMDAQRFQQHQTEQGWPIRIIITSRVTLIDKAAVPVGSTIIRLLEFDQCQRECWCSIWNKANASYFRNIGIEKFVLPKEKEDGAEKILNLARQPLLLLMLAIYDSQGNQLRISKGLDRTKLYDNLLRRFIIRERGKEKGFSDAQESEQKKILEFEMQRLGVAALGMYNRRKVHILSSELDEDLAFFRLGRKVEAKTGRLLSQSDMLLGGFFFVHKSKAQHCSYGADTLEETSAFEFLHNTFGEFLTADFIIQRAMVQVKALRATESQESLRYLRDKMIGTADGLEQEWFASLVYTPLFTRPVILEMIREWTPHVLHENSLSEDVFLETFNKVIISQLKRLLSNREMPQIMWKETVKEGCRVPFSEHPLIGHIAIYSINLVLLRLMVGKTPFIFNECEIATHEDGTRPWDRLIHIWRSWFSLENLNGLSAVMSANRNDSIIQITAKSQLIKMEKRGRINEFYNVSVALGDNASAGIIGLYLFDPIKSSVDDLARLERKLDSEKIDPGIPALIMKLLVYAKHINRSPNEFVSHGRRTLEEIVLNGRPDQLQAVCQIIVHSLEPGTQQAFRNDLFPRNIRSLYEPQLVFDIAVRDPMSARIIVGHIKQIKDTRWLIDFSNLFLERFFQRDDFSDRIPLFGVEFTLREWSEWLQLIRDLGDGKSPVKNLFRQTGLRASTGSSGTLFYSRRFLELSERNPEGALGYLQILQELLGGINPEDILQRDPAFIERIYNSRYLSKLSARNPEGVLIYLQILREFGGEHYFEDKMRFVNPAFLKRILKPCVLLELIERNPKGILSYLQIIRKFGGEHNWNDHTSMIPAIIERLYDPRHLYTLIERNSEGVLEYLEIIRELGLEPYFKDLDPTLMESLFSSRHLLELCERKPEGALDYLQILRALGGERYFEDNYIDTARQIYSRYFIELCERNPYGALSYLQIFRGLSGDRFADHFLRHMDSKITDRLFNSRHLLELCEKNPERALIYFQILREVFGRRSYKVFIEQENLDFNKLFVFWRMQNLSLFKVQSLGALLALARLLNSKVAIEALCSYVTELLIHRKDFKSQLSTLPITSISDLRWLAEQSGIEELNNLVYELIA